MHMRNEIVCLALLSLCCACSTQRYGRETPLSETEKAALTCPEIKIEIGKSEEFLSDIRMQRHDTNSAHVMGFLGDFGIGNSMEGDAAELSGERRLKDLKTLSAQKGC